MVTNEPMFSILSMALSTMKSDKLEKSDGPGARYIQYLANNIKRVIEPLTT